MLTPGSLLGAPKLQLFDNSGNPAAEYWLFTYIAGTSTALDTFSDSLLTVANSNPLQLDSYDRATVYLQPSIGYKFILTDTNFVPLWTQDNVYDLSTLLFSYLMSTEGAKGETSGYAILAADQLVTVNSTSTNPCLVFLPSAGTRTTPVRIKNIGTNPIEIHTINSDVIETGQTTFTIPPALSPFFPTVTLVSDQALNWWVFDGSYENGYGLQKTAGSITNAQMLTLPTTPITLLAAPGAALWARVWKLMLFPNFSGGAYTNIDATQSYIRAEYDGATNEAATIPILTRSAESLTYLNTFLGVTRRPTELWQAMNPQSSVFGPMPVLSDRANLLNSPVVLIANNNAAGNFTGGNAANTLTWLLYWTPETI